MLLSIFFARRFRRRRFALCQPAGHFVVADMDRRTGVIGAGLASSAFFFKESFVVLSFFLSLVRSSLLVHDAGLQSARGLRFSPCGILSPERVKISPFFT